MSVVCMLLVGQKKFKQSLLMGPSLSLEIRQVLLPARRLTAVKKARLPFPVFNLMKQTSGKGGLVFHLLRSTEGSTEQDTLFWFAMKAFR